MNFSTLTISILILLMSWNSHALDLDYSTSYVPALSLKSWDQESGKYKLDWQLRSKARRFDRKTDNSTIFSSSLRLTSQMYFYDQLRFYGNFDFVFQTGRSQSRYGDLSPNSGLYLNEAYFIISPFKKDRFVVELGAINQSRAIGNQVLVRRSSFPGLQEKVELLKTKNFKLQLRAQQLVPFSQTQGVNFAEAEKTPYLFTESLKLSYRGDVLNSSAHVGLFEYKNLPASVADASRVLGNSVVGVTNNSSFVYGFRGWFIHYSLDFKVDSFLIQADVDLVQNSLADNTYDRGHFYTLSVLKLGQNLNWGPVFSVFSLEPDVSPAFYNSSTLGNNNREGFSVALDFFLTKVGAKVYLEYVKADLLNKSLNLFQEDQERYTLGFKTRFRGINI